MASPSENQQRRSLTGRYFRVATGAATSSPLATGKLRVPLPVAEAQPVSAGEAATAESLTQMLPTDTASGRRNGSGSAASASGSLSVRTPSRTRRDSGAAARDVRVGVYRASQRSLADSDNPAPGGP